MNNNIWEYIPRNAAAKFISPKKNTHKMQINYVAVHTTMVDV